jgi:hypothetical protein
MCAAVQGKCPLESAIFTLLAVAPGKRKKNGIYSFGSRLLLLDSQL